MAKKKTKPTKPYPSFPLTAHPNGQWCKKIRGQVRFFGVWSDAEAALDRYFAEAADLHAGRLPLRVAADGVTIKEACNAYLGWQNAKLDAREIGPRWFEDCRGVLRDFTRHIGVGRPLKDVRVEELQRYRAKLARRLGVHALSRQITVIKAMFKHAYETELIDRPVKMAYAFQKPSAAQRRRARHRAEVENGKRLFRRDEVLRVLDASEDYLKPAVLLGVNGGFGNTDCATLPKSAVDLPDSLISYSRPKTGVQRVVPLWAETVAAFSDLFSQRTKVLQDEEVARLALVTARGNPLVRQNTRTDPKSGVMRTSNFDKVSMRFANLLERLELKRPGIGFYTLRHTFRTWADETHDQHAIHRIMGHALPGMSGVYIEEISLDRLRAVVDHVRQKLFSQ